MSAMSTTDLFELLDCADFYHMKKVKRAVVIAEKRDSYVQELVEQYVNKEFIQLCDVNAFDEVDLKTMD